MRNFLGGVGGAVPMLFACGLLMYFWADCGCPRACYVPDQYDKACPKPKDSPR